MAEEQFSLCWKNFHNNLSTGFHSLYQSEDLVDVTLAAEGRYLKAHKMVLSVCSQYFKELFQVNPCKHPIVILNDVSYSCLRDLLQFMYVGEVSVSQEELSTLMKVAQLLQIKGLTEEESTTHVNQNGIKYVHVKDVKSLVEPRNALKRSKTPRKTKPEVPVKLPKSGNTSSYEDSRSPNRLEIDNSPSMMVESELGEPLQLKQEPLENFSESNEYSEHSLPEMDMSAMLDTNLGETSSPSSSCWKLDTPKSSKSADINSPGWFMFTRSRKGKPHLIYDSNLFRPSGKIRDVRGHKYWECVQNRKTGCRARCLSINGKIETKCRDHNHPAPIDYINSRQNAGAVYYMTV